MSCVDNAMVNNTHKKELQDNYINIDIVYTVDQRFSTGGSRPTLNGSWSVGGKKKKIFILTCKI